MEFARRLGYKKLGLAFCNALSNKTKTIANNVPARGDEACGEEEGFNNS